MKFRSIIPSILLLCTLLVSYGFYKGISPWNNGVNKGDKAPEINLPSPDGKAIALSSLRGKWVLVDFWSSWCGPCRRENSNLVRLYNSLKDAEFKDAEGFAIYSVSLDYHKDRWTAAIQKDGLAWPNHVSDLKGWESAPAAAYGVNAIPSNFLVDMNGIVVGKNWSADDVEWELKKHLKK